MFEFEFSQTKDLPEIMKVYESAAQYQQSKNYNVWPLVAENTVLEEINLFRHIKVTKNNIITCVFTIAFSDPIIWDVRDNDSSLYLHRIATHLDFRGNNFMQRIVDWSKVKARENNKSILRLDTWADNENLKNYYLKFGYKIVGNKFLPPSSLSKHYWNIWVTLFEQEI